jgi:hypothetical protein
MRAKDRMRVVVVPGDDPVDLAKQVKVNRAATSGARSSDTVRSTDTVRLARATTA